MRTGIISYGVYIPRYRIRIEDIAKTWGKVADEIKSGLNIYEKSVPDLDEDTVTISVEASRYAIKRASIDVSRIGAIYVGSESHPYAVKPTATILSEAIGAENKITAADFEFACKAGTAAIQVLMGMTASGMIDCGLAVGADTSQGAPGDALEYGAAAGGAAFVIGSNPAEFVVEIEDTCSFTTDTPDFWRREGAEYPSHGGRFTGEPAYFKHVTGATLRLLDRIGAEPSDFDYAVFHQPNGKFPVRVARKLGFTMEQIEHGLIVRKIGNTYSASSLIGLAATLDVADPGSRILLTSFGSGAGSDSFSLRVTDRIKEIRDRAPKVEELLSRRTYLDYGLYAKHKGKIIL
ncbi:MAG TPA: hydroxymethylglutaryl-CoA synthase [Candidatus Syntrophoarchaeum butanivorans]|uniref:Hydroxymethylglutaryl-CoA synthase n=1 Tax=Candidatus Syntropharchaeum butanivorans TaxID=1839936 RepID=A0A7C1B7J1_9EURY|nr:MAG: hydroxymethylglutaryl-CoA synthase [Candidatus Syntrophoarchaeum sp. WYZ-LMO15]HDM36369.1 hydroxymethylglutaryl-CoA synthase [Candidatus Syntrophoarchaeum butanivorans]